jgi:hypothetical protein
MGKAKKPTKHAAQQRYEAAKVAEGAHIQVNIKFKSEADVKMFKKLRARFEDETDSAIVRMAVKRLAATKN